MLGVLGPGVMPPLPGVFAMGARQLPIKVPCFYGAAGVVGGPARCPCHRPPSLASLLRGNGVDSSPPSQALQGLSPGHPPTPSRAAHALGLCLPVVCRVRGLRGCAGVQPPAPRPLLAHTRVCSPPTPGYLVHTRVQSPCSQTSSACPYAEPLHLGSSCTRVCKSPTAPLSPPPHSPSLLLPVEVGQAPESRSPLAQVVVVLVLVRQAGDDGAEGAGDGARALVVVDEGRVVGGHAGVAVGRLQPLWGQGGTVSPRGDGGTGGKGGAPGPVPTSLMKSSMSEGLLGSLRGAGGVAELCGASLRTGGLARGGKRSGCRSWLMS